jgi:hypothetical protein
MTTAAARSPAHGRGIGAERARRGGAHNHRERRDDLVRRRPGAPAHACSGVRRSRTAHGVRHRAQLQHANACDRTPGLRCSCGKSRTRSAAKSGSSQRRRQARAVSSRTREALPRPSLEAQCPRRAGHAARAVLARASTPHAVLSAASAARPMLHVVCWMVPVAFVARCMLQEHLEKRLESAINDVEMVGAAAAACSMQYETATCTIRVTRPARQLAPRCWPKLQQHVALGCNNVLH